MKAELLLNALADHGFWLFSGVPCSYLSPLINAVIDSPSVRYINAANEGEAVAICSGAGLGGVRAVAMFQNSGLGNAVSPLTSLNAVFRIPVLLIVTWRGQPGGPADEPQHSLLGSVMPKLFDIMQIRHALLPTDEADLRRVLCEASDSMKDTGLPYALILRKGVIDASPLRLQPPMMVARQASPPDLSAEAADVDEILTAISEAGSQRSAAVLATTGFTGRALHNLGDRENQFYMVGSMGCVSSLALGLALVRNQRQVIAVDGDGALLMHMGALGAIAAAKPNNLTHIVLDNGVHDSTGAQATLAHSVNIPGVAIASGYPSVEIVRSPDELRALLRSPATRLRLIYVRTLPRADRELPRPTVTPEQVVLRMRAWLRGE